MIEIDNCVQLEENRCLVATINRKQRNVPIDFIDYVESRGRKIVLHLNCGEITFYSKMSDIEGKLMLNGFIRVHQSFMIRKKDIVSFNRTMVKHGKVEIPVSRKYYSEIKKCVVRG